MKTLRWIILALASVSFLSCVASLLPLFEDRYLVYEPGLLGTWKPEKSADTWTFENGEGKEYLLVQHQAEYGGGSGLGKSTQKAPGDTVRFRARLGRLAEGLFLDLLPAEEGNPEIRNDWYNIHMIPAHTLARVWLEKDSLRIVFLEEDWVKNSIDSGLIKPAYVKTDNWLVLTGPTADLQSLILKHANDDKAFPLSEGEELHRVKAN